jgi:hypothetical protein
MYDIIFISYDESNADENFTRLKERFPLAKRVHGVEGIHNAHIAAARKSSTKMLWVVDGDAKILESFNFTFDNAYKEIDLETVYVYRSQNPINGLSYGYGGVKLLPKNLTLNMDASSTDMTTSISNKFIPLPEISNITLFNSSPFSTWRSAFRECVKLSSKSIDRQKSIETKYRLNTWCTLAEDVPYGFYAYIGALSGRNYGEKNASNKEALSKINDFNWLQDRWLMEKSQLSLEHTQ